MKYSKFTLINYKGIPKIELDLNKKPQSNIFTLVGLNESGKTSLLEGIYLFYSDISNAEAYSLIPKSRQYSFSDHISIIAELEIESKDYVEIKRLLEDKYKFYLAGDIPKIEITKKYNFNKSTPLEDDNWKQILYNLPFEGKTKKSKKIARLHEWKNEAWQEVSDLIRKKLLPKILYYPDFLFKFPEKIYLESFDKEGTEQEEYRSVIRDILQSIDTNLTLEEDLLLKMKKSDDKAYKDSLSQLLLKMSSKLNEEILKKWDTIFGSGQKKEVNINWSSETYIKTDGTEGVKYFLELKIKQGSDNYSINDRSLGFRWFFSFLIFTAFRKSRSSDPGETLFLLDEPASNLHQRSQQKLLQSLDEIVSKCKLIYSTHSHHMINPKWLTGTYIVKNEAINYGNPEEAKTSETKIDAIAYKNFVAKYPDEVDHFKPILDALQYTPSKLEIVPYTVFTEGKNDYYTFKYFTEVIFKGKFDISFYPGAGAGKYSDVFRLYLAWNRKFIAIFDSDLQGKKEKERYASEIGPDINNKIFTLENINGSWQNLATEDLFTDTEKMKIMQTSFPANENQLGYDKSKFNTALQQLYIDNQQFKFNKGTNDKFKTILEFIVKKFEDNNS